MPIIVKPSRKIGERLFMAELEHGQIQEFGPGLAESVKEGLSKPSNLRTLPCKFFYDERGSEIFEKITDLEEYYPTRCERQILVSYSDEISKICGSNTTVVELGSGSSSKTRTLLEAFMKMYGKTKYVPIDISSEFLEKTSIELLREYPEKLSITAVPGLYQQGLQYMKESSEFQDTKKLVCFFGSSIGNFTRSEAVEFVKDIGNTMGIHDKFLIGVDLKKEIPVLVSAYNDAQGVTADFNLNLLVRINRELDADFDLSQFKHESVWNEEEGRIEMRIYSTANQTVHIKSLDLEVTFQNGEFIHTENCYKYSLAEIRQLADSSGFKIDTQWLDDTGRFTLSIFSKKDVSQR